METKGEKKERKLTRKEKSIINKYNWKLKQRARNYRLRRKKKMLKERKMAGDVKSDFSIVVTMNGKRYKTLYRGKWSIAANEWYNRALEENRENVKFPVMYTTTNRHLKPFISEILLIRKNDGTFDPSMKAPIRDEDGKILDLVVADDKDSIITRRDVWRVEEKFSMTGPHPFRQRKGYGYLVGFLKGIEGMLRVMRLGVRLVMLTDDDGIEYVRCKSVADCERLYDTLADEKSLSGKLVMLGAAEGENVSWLTDRLVEKTGRPRRTFLKNGYQNERPQP